MPLTLLTSDVEAYGLGPVTATDIADAKTEIHASTGWTVDEHATTRGIAEGAVLRAWAIVSDRMAKWTGSDPTDPQSESQGDYNYTRSEGSEAHDLYPDYLAGPPKKLLRIPISVLTRADHRLPANDPGYLPPMLDDYGVPFPRV